MKINKKYLNKIIKEELQKVLNETGNTELDQKDVENLQSTKDKVLRELEFSKTVVERVKPKLIALKEKNEQDLLSEFSSSEFRNAISENNIQMVDSYLPEEILSSEDYKNRAYKILGIQKELGELKESSIIQLINKQLQTPVKSNKLNLGDLISRVNSIYNK